MPNPQSYILTLDATGVTCVPATPATLWAIATQYVTPSTGASVTCTGGSIARLLVNPAGTLLALTIVLPTSPADGDEQTIASSQAITGLTITGTIVGTLTTLALGAFATFKYNATSSKWFRIA